MAAEETEVVIYEDEREADRAIGAGNVAAATDFRNERGYFELRVRASMWRGHKYGARLHIIVHELRHIARTLCGKNTKHGKKGSLSLWRWQLTVFNVIYAMSLRNDHPDMGGPIGNLDASDWGDMAAFVEGYRPTK